jgi:cell division protein FtsB
MTATASKRKSTVSNDTNIVKQLEDAKSELAIVHRFMEKVQTFSNVVGDAKKELDRLKAEEHQVSEELRELREQIKSLKELISSASDGMLALIEPGPIKFMPLFDQMEKASPTKHGTNAAKWRELPLSSLRLSPASASLLYAAELLFIGQLQDRVLADPENWWETIEGLTAPIAAAIADKLADFAKKGGDV